MCRYNISIIVPIYNGEKYLDACLNSLISQTMKSIEIICVNDGSTDSSINILNRYKEINENIKVINIENQGVWEARKIGINAASGAYIGFCDCDDEVYPQMYEKMYKSIVENECEMALCGFSRIGDNNEILSKEMIDFKYDKINLKDNSTSFSLLNTSLWNKLFKKEILSKVINFEQPPRVAEDMMFLLSIITEIKKICFIDEVLYKYYVRPTGAMSSLEIDEIDNIINNMILTKKHVLSLNNTEEIEKLIDLMAFIHIGISLSVLSVKVNMKHLNDTISYIKMSVNKYFPKYKIALKSYNKSIKKKNFIKVKVAIFIFNSPIYTLAINIYDFLIRVLKIEMKW